MSLREHEQKRSRHTQRTHQKQSKHEKRRQEILARRKRLLDALPATLSDDMVLTVSEWAAMNRISTRTGRRILASGRGPTVTQLSSKRTGITIRVNRTWQASRERV
jgi:hypothetical protein